MKILTTFLASLLSLGLLAQNVTISFAGANANNNRNYQVVIDGTSYYANNSTADNGRRSLTVPGLALGNHELEVYIVGNNNSTYNNGNNSQPSGDPVYSKTFQLRANYDMNINIRGNGTVSFSEKKATTGQQYGLGYTPMSNASFNQLLQSVNTKRYQSQRIAAVNTAFTNSGNHFTSSQVKQLLTLISSDNSRLDLGKKGYGRVTDPANFSIVYDVLSSQASRDALDDYVVSRGGMANNGYANNTVDNNAAYNNRVPLSDDAFSQLLQKARNHFFQSGTVTDIRNALNTTSGYFTAAQLVQLLSLVTNEGEKLSLAKLAYNRTSDPYNFSQVVGLFNSQVNRDELNNYVTANGGAASTGNNNTYYNNGRTAMADTDFNQLYQKARNHFFQNSITTDVSNAFTNTANYFSTYQVQQLLLLVKDETTRLSLAKLAYARTTDPSSFSQLANLFTTQANKNELNNYIRTQQ
jgi:hypothetical protein